MSQTPTTDAPPENGLTPEQRAAQRAGDTSQLGVEEAHDATEYFLGKRPAPNKGTTFTLEVDFGTLEDHDYRRVTFKPLRIEDLDDADERSAMKDAEGDVIGYNNFIRASWIFAKACVNPRLGPVLEARNGEGAGFPDSATLLQDLFAEAPGVLIDVANAIRRRARIGSNDSSVREVEAGKTSS